MGVYTLGCTPTPSGRKRGGSVLRQVARISREDRGGGGVVPVSLFHWLRGSRDKVGLDGYGLRGSASVKLDSRHLPRSAWPSTITQAKEPLERQFGYVA